MRALPDDQPWVFDLASPDDARRAAALGRHRELLAGAAAARQPRSRLDRTLGGLVTAFSRAEDPAVRQHYAPYAVLFLRWEARFLPELRASWPYSPWTTKAVVLRDLTRGGVPPEQEPELAELTVAALRRPYGARTGCTRACCGTSVRPGCRPGRTTTGPVSPGTCWPIRSRQ